MIPNPIVVDVDIGNTNPAIPISLGTAITITSVLQETSAVPSEEEQVILPDQDYDGMSKVVIAPIPSNYGRLIRVGANLKVY
jgi:hypothetical protein